MASALDEMVKGLAQMTQTFQLLFKNQTQSKASSYESEESKLKSQNEGWNLGGHPRLP